MGHERHVHRFIQTEVGRLTAHSPSLPASSSSLSTSWRSAAEAKGIFEPQRSQRTRRLPKTQRLRLAAFALRRAGRLGAVRRVVVAFAVFFALRCVAFAAAFTFPFGG